MAHQFPKSVDELKKLAEDAASSMHPAEFGGLAVQHQIETEHGQQPLFFLVPAAQQTEFRKPGIPMTTLDDQGNIGKPRLFLPGENGGYRLATRMMTDPRAASFVVAGDPNTPADRLRTGGLGITTANEKQLEFGAGAWVYSQREDAQFYTLPFIRRYINDNPGKIVGWQEVVINNGSVYPLSQDRQVPGGRYHFYSDKGLETVARVPVTARMVEALGNIGNITMLHAPASSAEH